MYRWEGGGESELFQSLSKLDDTRNPTIMKPESEDIKKLHFLICQMILNWLDRPPKDIREVKALELLAEANQNLYAAFINLNLTEQAFVHKPVKGLKDGQNQ